MSDLLKSILDFPGVVMYHFREGNIHWPLTIFLGLSHIGGVIGLFVMFKCKLETLVLTHFINAMGGFGITVGAHRYWSHRSFEACSAVRVGLLICNSIANQGNIFHWAREHRIHHKYSETDADPHNAKRGFFFSHVGWLLLKPHPDLVQAREEMDVSDLLEDPLVSLQKKLSPWLGLYMCFIFPAQVVTYVCGEDFWNAFYVAGALRYCVALHFTWLVNSAAHLYGNHPYDPDSHPAENPLVSYAALGEGWHNWHHKYPFDYAASEFGISAQFNPSKLVIDTLAAFGLVWGRKRGTAAWAAGRKRRDEAAGVKPNNGSLSTSNGKKDHSETSNGHSEMSNGEEHLNGKVHSETSNGKEHSETKKEA